MGQWLTLRPSSLEPQFDLPEVQMKETVRSTDPTARSRARVKTADGIAVGNALRRYDYSELAKQWSEASYDLAKFG